MSAAGTSKSAQEIKLENALRRDILRSLRNQGFCIRRGHIYSPSPDDKNALRQLHSTAVAHQRLRAREALAQKESKLLRYIANGYDLDPLRIRPVLVQVRAKTELSLLFQYLQLHWSIPISQGYGRRLRFLVFDETTGHVMGLIGLGDPVYSLGPRDKWIGWSAEKKRQHLYQMMDAYVLGAVPPYSYLLAGKLIALLALCNEVSAAFEFKYSDRPSLISKQDKPAQLLLVTTSSALGRSSLYNRLSADGYSYWRHIGNTKGSGDFHFANGLYSSIREYAEQWCEATAKRNPWGEGFRNKREVIRKVLIALNLPRTLIYHGVSRPIYAAPLSPDTQCALRGECLNPKMFDWSIEHLFAIFRNRWMIGRMERDSSYKRFLRDDYRLWATS